MPGRAGLLLTLTLMISLDCTAQRVSLHGFFGRHEDIRTVKKLLLPSGPLALPPSWDRGVPLEEFEGKHRPLYMDPNLSTDPRGDDSRTPYGLESSTLAFYVGEGDLSSWHVPHETDPVGLGRIHVGDGLLRYFWLHTCNVMAHGPKDRHDDYSQPQRWTGACGEADVFDRWHPAFGPGLRMVCGGSTQIGVDELGEIWDNLLEKETTVSDAFILGLAHLAQVPLCLARGGENPASSALADRTLHTERIHHGDWLHLQIPVRCNVTHIGFMLLVECGSEAAAAENSAVTSGGASMPPPAPEMKSLPRVETTKVQSPVLPQGDKWPLGFEQFLGNDSKYHPSSGAVVLVKGHDDYTQIKSCGEVKTWLLNPRALLGQKGFAPGFLPITFLDSDGPREISDATLSAVEMRVESRRDGSLHDRKCWSRGLFVRFDSEVNIGSEEPLPIFGPGVTLEIPRRENQFLASFSSPHRKLKVLQNEDHPIKPEKTIISEARQELHLDPEIYPEGTALAILGYEEAPLRCEQYFLRPTYEIRFAPAKSDHPTIVLRRDARDSTDKSGSPWKCRDWNG